MLMMSWIRSHSDSKSKVWHENGRGQKTGLQKMMDGKADRNGKRMDPPDLKNERGG